MNDDVNDEVARRVSLILQGSNVHPMSPYEVVEWAVKSWEEMTDAELDDIADWFENVFIPVAQNTLDEW